MQIGKLVNEGEEVSAGAWNSLVLQLRRMWRLKVSDGKGAINGVLALDGMSLAIANTDDETFVLSRIATRSSEVAAKQNTVTYSVAAIDEQNVTLPAGTVPKIGRPANATQASLVMIYPAEVGTLCWIVRKKQSDGSFVPELWLPAGAETAKMKVCST
jgi:hypothetical protein